MAAPLLYDPITGEKGVYVYRTKEAFPTSYQKEGGLGIWYPSQPFPGGYSLVKSDYPVMKPMGIKNIEGKLLVTGFNLKDLASPRNLILVAGAAGLILYRKPLLKMIKKTGRKVGIK